VTPEASVYLDAASQDLVEARINALMKVWRQAARLSYYAQFHAAQALIFERTGKTAKTHKGVHALFHKLARVEVAIPPGAAVALVEAYRHKEVADYDFGTALPVTEMQANKAVTTAERFVAAVLAALSAPAP
jgi:uncharacterized protein (UPF0332 family)